MKQQLILRANSKQQKNVHLMKHSLHWKNMKINIIQRIIITFLIPLSQTCTSLLVQQALTSHFVICNLYIAIWVIQIKCKSCKIIKTLTSMHVPGTKLEGSLVQLVQILRFEG